MEPISFVLKETLKVLGIALASVLAAKAVEGLGPAPSSGPARRLARARTWLYLAIVGLAVLGARNVGYDVAAEVYYWAGLRDAQGFRYLKAYHNAHQAVALRPAVPRYWEALEACKMDLHQFASLAEDLPAMRRVTGGDLDESDSYRFAVSLFLLGRYDEAGDLTERIISRNRFFVPPHILQGEILTAQRKYGEARRAFLAALQILPTDQAAVEGLAHACYLEGNRAQALSVLDEASRLSFPSEARARFRALKDLYGQ